MKRKTSKGRTASRNSKPKQRGPSGASTGKLSAWRQRLIDELPALGHRNWIVVADAAYPTQCRPGIETIATGADQLEVVEVVVGMLDRSRHVRPIIHLDLELQHLSEELAPGIDAYRNRLGRLLAGRVVQSVPHEELIAELDKAGQVFRILILKTMLMLPYTSVFAQLDCGYWSTEAEAKLREAMKG